MRYTLAVAVLISSWSPAFAQPAEEIPPLKPGTSIFLTTTSGEEVFGRAGEVTSGAMEIVTASGSRRVTRAGIQRIERIDANRDGVLAGAVAGAALGWIVVSRSDVCPDRGFLDGLCRKARTGTAIIGALGGMLAGGLIDQQVKRRRTIFERTEPASVSFVVDVQRVAVEVRW